MKKIKLLTSSSLLITAIASLPFCVLTSCSSKQDQDKFITINFDAGEGKIKSGSAEYKFDKDKKVIFGQISKPEVIAENKIFAGWKTIDSDGKNIDLTDDAEITKNIIAKANYVDGSSGIYQQVTFKAAQDVVYSGNTVVAVKTGHPFFTINKPIASKTGFVFSHWATYDGETYTPVNDLDPITNSMEVYPIFNTIPALNDSIYSVTSDNKVYVWDINTICSPDSDISGVDYSTGKSLDPITRSDFNYPVYVGSNITNIPDYFLANCSSFNSQLVLTPNTTTIGNYFLSDCVSFNVPFLMPTSLESIGTHFLANASSFNQNVLLPSTLNSIGNNFMNSCDSFTSVLTVNCNPTIIDTSTGDVLCSYVLDSAIYQTGYDLAGTYANAFWKQFADTSDTGSYFRRRTQQTFKTLSVVGSIEGSTDKYVFSITSGSFTSWNSSYDVSLNIDHIGTTITSGNMNVTVVSVVDDLGNSLTTVGTDLGSFAYDATQTTLTIPFNNSIKPQGNINITLSLTNV